MLTSVVQSLFYKQVSAAIKLIFLSQEVLRVEYSGHSSEISATAVESIRRGTFRENHTSEHEEHHTFHRCFSVSENHSFR